ncbi:MAG: UDP-4-amino-4,6-dideoxy-N-acetyl-beta-L-altrosamine transaminase [Helicobacteraceae bacterium]|jgi:UDP-4-amino-4,6-dideoxy-L-N-acetyl-beta-L-altrosamine transaminase|nr:UDP-4-amino-4,6-dideoxy-N-acetyl-beta-L-altrosamine transaminase [Helicobacteraceae bacterium]
MYLDRYGSQVIDENDIEAVCAALRSGVLTQGAAVEAFERALCEYTGATYAIAVSSGTAGLHLAYLAAGLGADDEIVVPAITFAATANAALYCGAKPVFADIEFESGLIDPRSIEDLIASKTKAIAPVHYAGNLCDMKTINEIAAERKLIVIEDASHAIGSFNAQGASAGTFGAMGVFSFHPVKPITTGEGGAVITNDLNLARKLRLLRSHGIERGGLWEQDMTALGFNYRISDINCALGISQLKKLDETIDRREAIAALYDQAFAKSALIEPLKSAQKRGSRHLYPVLIDSVVDKTKLFAALREKNIGVQKHYRPVYRHSFYRAALGDHSPLPNAERFYEAELSIPCHAALSDGEVARAIEILLALTSSI